ncbi:MAG TPA: ATP-binding protein [Vitreimonas sp.]|nr:ATP-binding protein [Vitreimonas sp.]
MSAVILNKIYQSAIKLLMPLTPELTYKTIIDEAKNLVAAESGSIFLLRNGVLVREYSSVPLDKRFEPRRDGNLYLAFKNKKTMVIASNEMGRVHPEIYKSKTQTVMLIPLYFNQKSLGVVALRSDKSYRLTQERKQYLEVFGSLASLTIRNTELYSDMKKALETKGLFLSMASHELKTPLTTISGYAQLLYKNLNEGKEVNKDWVNKMNEQSFRLTKLINELLVVNELRIGKIKPQWENISLSEIIETEIKEVKKLFPDREIVVETDVTSNDSCVMGDKEKLGRVVMNVLHNAVKFSAAGTVVVIKLRKTKNEFEIEITDDGIGISEEELPYIFDEFYKGSNHMEPGMGLGLFITRKILDKHKGDIAIESEPKQGTQVFITLPANLD